MTDRPVLVRFGVGGTIHVADCHHARTAGLAGTAVRWAWADTRNSGEIARAVTAHGLHPCRTCKPISTLARWEAEQRAAERPTGILPTPEELLDFERAHPARDGRKWHEVQRQFGLSPARYVQLLLAAARSEEGLRFDAQTAHHINDRVREGVEARAALLRRGTR